ncbi:hypothetical protein Glove_259g3 [Diversispora epigaea]|uniref:Uncharacterized protein n=1 Tax=Diversispora epigaea TaxID=1348612 RepID=A0A397I915_9GLOM|nr:hypothetical protein Glove_259g3 [Diversispora epigaea]
MKVENTGEILGGYNPLNQNPVPVLEQCCPMLSMFQCYPVFQYSRVPVLSSVVKYFNIPVYPILSSIPMFQSPTPSVSVLSNAVRYSSAAQYSNAQIYSVLSSIPVFQHFSCPVSQLPIFQCPVSVLSSVLIFQCPVFQCYPIFQYSNIQCCSVFQLSSCQCCLVFQFPVFRCYPVLSNIPLFQCFILVFQYSVFQCCPIFQYI